MWLNILVTNNLLLKESIPLKGLKSKVSVGRQGDNLHKQILMVTT